MKFSPHLTIWLPLIMQLQLPMQRLLSLHNSRTESFGDYCFDSLLFATFSFFFIEGIWFIFRTKIVKVNSTYPFWQTLLPQILTNAKGIILAFVWILFVAIMWATLTWGAEFFTQKSVAHFSVYLKLSLLLNFYLAALFCIWYLFLAPRFGSSSAHRKLTPNQ